MPSSLIDSSFLYALFQKSDKRHAEARDFADRYNLAFLIPEVVLPEATYLFQRDGDAHDIAGFLQALSEAQSKFVCLTLEDITRAGAIMLDYPDARFDFVDCAIMALAERHNVTKVCTFDRRDFSIFRPTHTEYLELLP